MRCLEAAGIKSAKRWGVVRIDFRDKHRSENASHGEAIGCRHAKQMRMFLSSECRRLGVPGCNPRKCKPSRVD